MRSPNGVMDWVSSIFMYGVYTDCGGGEKCCQITQHLPLTRIYVVCVVRLGYKYCRRYEETVVFKFQDVYSPTIIFRFVFLFFFFTFDEHTIQEIINKSVTTSDV